MIMYWAAELGSPKWLLRNEVSCRRDPLIISESGVFCGQTLNNDGLVSVWFNDEDCLAYVRDAYFLNR